MLKRINSYQFKINHVITCIIYYNYLKKLLCDNIGDFFL